MTRRFLDIDAGARADRCRRRAARRVTTALSFFVATMRLVHFELDDGFARREQRACRAATYRRRAARVRRASYRARRSRSRTAERSTTTDQSAGRYFAGRSLISATRPAVVMDRRSIRFASSRTLPGHGHSASAASARCASCTSARPSAHVVRGEVADQQRQVFETRAQGRHLDGEHVEAMEQILAERALDDVLFEIAMSRGDDAHVTAHRHVVAHALEHALLEHAEQLHLHGGAHVADLVEEQRAALGDLEPALAGGDGAREGALLMAEQLALEQFGGDRSAVHRDERDDCDGATDREWRGRPLPCRCPTRRGSEPWSRAPRPAGSDRSLRGWPGDAPVGRRARARSGTDTALISLAHQRPSGSRPL